LHVRYPLFSQSRQGHKIRKIKAHEQYGFYSTYASLTHDSLFVLMSVRTFVNRKMQLCWATVITASTKLSPGWWKWAFTFLYFSQQPFGVI